MKDKALTRKFRPVEGRTGYVPRLNFRITHKGNIKMLPSAVFDLTFPVYRQAMSQHLKFKWLNYQQLNILICKTWQKWISTKHVMYFASHCEGIKCAPLILILKETTNQLCVPLTLILKDTANQLRSPVTNIKGDK